MLGVLVTIVGDLCDTCGEPVECRGPSALKGATAVSLNVSRSKTVYVELILSSHVLIGFSLRHGVSQGTLLKLEAGEK